MNVSNENWRKFAIEKMRLLISSPNYTGTFVDNATVRIQNWMIGIPTLPIDYEPLNWETGTKEFLDSMYALANPIGHSFFNGLSDDSSVTLLSHTDGGLFEGYIYAPWWSGNGSYWDWRRCQNQAIKTRHSYGKIFLAQARVPAEDTASRIFAYASYLLIVDDSVYYANADKYNVFGLFPEMEIPIGYPVETANNDIDELKSYEGVYIRHFSNGVVVVNPYGEDTIVVTDDFPYYRVIVTPGTIIDGSRLYTVTRDNPDITLYPKSAAIFLNDSIFSPGIDSVCFNPNSPITGETNLLSVKVIYKGTVEVRAVFEDINLCFDLYDDGTHGDAIAGDSIFSAEFCIPIGTPNEKLNLYIQALDENGLFSVKFDSVMPIITHPNNLLYNWSFELDIDNNGIPDGWANFGNSPTYCIDSLNCMSGTKSVKFYSCSIDSIYGIHQSVYLNQELPTPLVVSGYSKARDVSGLEDHNYSIYVDVYCKDGSTMYGECAIFPTGTHDWVYVKHLIEPKAPIEWINLIVRFKHHTGTVWFDDVGVYEIAPMDMDERGELKIERPDFYFSITPNPLGDLGILKAYVPGDKPKVLRLYNAAGRLVRAFELRPGMNILRWKTDGLPNGAYFLCSEKPRKALKTLILK